MKIPSALTSREFLESYCNRNLLITQLVNVYYVMYFCEKYKSIYYVRVLNVPAVWYKNIYMYMQKFFKAQYHTDEQGNIYGSFAVLYHV